MGRTIARVTSVKASRHDNVVGGYSSNDIMQLCRSAKQRSELKAVAFDGLDSLYVHTMETLARTGNRCECCHKEFEKKSTGKGGGGNNSLSLHRVIASQGYIVDNIRIICMACNGAIGETNTYQDIIGRVKALRWQAKIMMRAAKIMLANEGLVE